MYIIYKNKNERAKLMQSWQCCLQTEYNFSHWKWGNKPLNFSLAKLRRYFNYHPVCANKTQKKKYLNFYSEVRRYKYRISKDAIAKHQRLRPESPTTYTRGDYVGVRITSYETENKSRARGQGNTVCVCLDWSLPSNMFNIFDWIIS